MSRKKTGGVGLRPLRAHLQRRVAVAAADHRDEILPARGASGPGGIGRGLDGELFIGTADRDGRCKADEERRECVFHVNECSRTGKTRLLRLDYPHQKNLLSIRRLTAPFLNKS